MTGSLAPRALAGALTEWRRALGDEHVVTSAEQLRQALAATLEHPSEVWALLRPGSREQLRQLVLTAQRHRVPLYTVSTGKNWGLGSRLPVRPGCVLVELSRLTTISDFDPELATVTVEPGVTFQQLYDFLAAQGAPLFVSVTGASPGASVIGNTLERGDGAGVYGDRVHQVCAFEALLATGETVSTGFARFGQVELARLHRFGVGPALDGLLTQSNFAIVTRLTVWLQRLPRGLSVVRFSLRQEQRLPPLVQALQALRLDGTLRSVVGLWNDYRVLSTRQRYPWELTQGATPLTRAQLATLAPAWGGGRWFGTAALYAPSPAVGAALREHVQATLGPLVDELEIQSREGEPKSGAELFHEGDPAFRFLQGIPHQGSLASVYWRWRGPLPAALDPDRDGCGVLWCCPTLPFRGSALAAAAELAEEVMLRHGFEPLLACLAQTERCLYLVPLIIYDRRLAGEDARARACHDELLTRYVELGFLPYRLGVQSMGALPPSVDDTDALLRRLKRLFDPAGLLSPGRYEPSD